MLVYPGVVRVRPMTPDDAPAVADVWYRAWRDGHLGHVPDELVALRTPESFGPRAAARVPGTCVADVDGQVAGFATVVGDELEELFVDAGHRGSGVAAALLADAEHRLAAAGVETAWLAVVAGNARARRFYAKQGWRDDGPFDYAAEGPDGTRIPVPCRRYVKELRQA
ncbi:GCN5-related N-acetyltransferase [Isoptericola variabilis 225]|uniref:GCN5-related N-acetyltransferase n=1 Tax=Isoptericola variabilis (strain 225) TaxID=743718 RepID=F6FXF9_ISOV2|nr:GCN5-related N-acetyltransferase [Isoptericola variabilis 225]